MMFGTTIRKTIAQARADLITWARNKAWDLLEDAPGWQPGAKSYNEGDMLFAARAEEWARDHGWTPPAVPTPPNPHVPPEYVERLKQQDEAAFFDERSRGVWPPGHGAHHLENPG